jgi:hypothetical protein
MPLSASVGVSRRGHIHEHLEVDDLIEPGPEQIA